jgi:hypothetical protein
VLDGFETMKICTGYRLDGETIDYLPANSECSGRVRADLRGDAGWSESTAGARSLGGPAGAGGQVRPPDRGADRMPGRLNGGGRLMSYDQHAGFVEATAMWLAGHGLSAVLRHAPLVEDPSTWSHTWYDLQSLPSEIDLLVIDGPPWTQNPFVRGRAEVLFERIAPGGMVLLDDAARPGERVVAARWRQDWPEFRWTLLPGAKGTLAGERLR